MRRPFKILVLVALTLSLPVTAAFAADRDLQSRRNTTAANHPVMIAIIAVVKP